MGTQRVVFLGTPCVVRKEGYANGGTCLRLSDRVTGEPVATATSWIPGLAPDEVAVKDYRENAGMLDALLAAGVVMPPHRTAPAGAVSFQVCRLA